jgi:ABC-type transport system substrate-binding protein
VADTDERRKILRVGLLTELQKLDPRETQEYASAVVLAQIFEPPYASDPEGGTPTPALFEGPLRSDLGAGGAVYRARVCEGLEFSNGAPLTATIVARSLSAVPSVKALAAVSAGGEDVVFTMDRPNSRLASELCQRWCSIVLESDGGLFGTGPYAVAPDTVPGCVHLVRNPHARRRAKIDEILFQVYPPSESGQADGLLRAVDSGEVDFTTVLSREDVGRLGGVRKLFQPGISTALLFFNTERPFTGRAEVRRALALAVNRHWLAGICYTNAAAFAARSLLPPAMTQLRETARYDPDRARSLLQAAGGPPASPLRLLEVWGPRPYLPHPDRVALAICDQLGRIGVPVETVATGDVDVYFNALLEGEYDMVLGGWIADTPNPADFLDATLLSELVPAADTPAAISCNLARHRNADMDEALRRYREQPTTQNMAEVLACVRDQAPLVPLMHGPSVVVHSWRVQNYEPQRAAAPDFSVLDLDD